MHVQQPPGSQFLRNLFVCQKLNRVVGQVESHHLNVFRNTQTCGELCQFGLRELVGYVENNPDGLRLLAEKIR